MKTAYQKFDSKGFEIVSFTLDDEGERWKKASEEEQLPWINVGDLLAYKSPVVRMFGINGIPANYLVDSSGKIIAKALRGKNLDDNLSVMKALNVFKAMGYALLLGTSRKSMIGQALDLPVSERLEGTLATTVLGFVEGCRIFRVHDVKENLRALKMTELMR